MIFNQQYISQHFLPIVVALQVIMYITLFLDFPLARAAIGIAYLTFVPGFILIKILKLDNLNTVESIVYSAGFSVAFLMLAGLIINQFGYLIGISFPLATLPLSLFVNTLIIVGAAAAYLRQGRSKTALPTKKITFSRSMLLFALIPVLSIIGAYFVDATSNNIILLVMILGIAGLFT